MFLYLLLSCWVFPPINSLKNDHYVCLYPIQGKEKGPKSLKSRAFYGGGHGTRRSQKRTSVEIPRRKSAVHVCTRYCTHISYLPPTSLLHVTHSDEAAAQPPLAVSRRLSGSALPTSYVICIISSRGICGPTPASASSAAV